MLEYTKKIREIAERLLKEGKVDMVIGFRKGTLPMINEPHFVKRAEDVNELYWDTFCAVNLANYLTDRKERIAIVAKGCDSRNIVNHIIENKVKKDKIVVIGVPCKGMLGRRKIALAAGGSEILEVIDGAKVTIKSKAGVKEVDRKDVTQDNCIICTHRNPVIYDELVAEKVEEQKNVDRYEDVKKIEAMSVQEKNEYFDTLLSTCIRCYACRNACPLCYCPTCFVDESKPQWVGKSIEETDIKTFHFLRAYHCAGRCTDCGSCERVCPMNIKMRVLTKKLEKDCFDQFGWEAGLSLTERPPLDTYKPNDPQDFIK
ncbi:MAG: 4Fe-4S dicluster domain-containing protein [Desulfobacterales bacterium]|nr:4Fe-4S dicluster domain-containing protein [Desulfobacterales bacterium]MBF0397012.1 4Fe-4S dicluster domain-containing protein [Desulfobacterales bacterium]